MSCLYSRKKGFTLVEMLVVIAIIAILVSILIPTVLGAVTKAKAATDAANLRAVQAVMNITLLDSDKDHSSAAAQAMTYACKSFPNAESYAVFVSDTIVEVYYVLDRNWYGVNYFSKLAETGNKSDCESEIKTEDDLPTGCEKLPAGNNTASD